MKITNSFILNLTAFSLFFVSCCETSIVAQKEDVKTLQQYLLPLFSEAKIKFRSGSTQTALMNYNKVTQKMVYLKNDKYFDVTNADAIDTIYLQNRKFVHYENFFLELIPGCTMTFYVQNRSVLVSAGKPAGYGTTSQTSSITSITSLQDGSGVYNLKLPDEYTVHPNPVYWIKINSTMLSFLTERQLSSIFPGKRENNQTVHQRKQDQVFKSGRSFKTY